MAIFIDPDGLDWIPLLFLLAVYAYITAPEGLPYNGLHAKVGLGLGIGLGLGLGFGVGLGFGFGLG